MAKILLNSMSAENSSVFDINSSDRVISSYLLDDVKRFAEKYEVTIDQPKHLANELWRQVQYGNKPIEQLQGPLDSRFNIANKQQKIDILFSLFDQEHLNSISMQGLPGTGKTIMIKLLTHALVDSNIPVAILYPNEGARKSLKKNICKLPAEILEKNNIKLVSTDALDTLNIIPKSIIIADEFTKLSNESLFALASIVKNNTATLLPIGDPLQTGNPLATKIMQLYKEKRLTYPDRQQNPRHRDAIAKIAAGDIRGGPKLLLPDIRFGQSLQSLDHYEPSYSFDYVPMLKPNLIITNDNQLVDTLKNQLDDGVSTDVTTIDHSQGASEESVRVHLSKGNPMTQQLLL